MSNVRTQHDFLKDIPRMAEITVPSHYIDWKSKQLSLPSNSGYFNNSNVMGRREWPLTVEEPHYVLVRTDEDNPRHLGNNFYLNSVLVV